MAIQQKGETSWPDSETTRSESLSGEMRSNATASDTVRIRVSLNLFDKPQTLSEHDGGTDSGG